MPWERIDVRLRAKVKYLIVIHNFILAHARGNSRAADSWPASYITLQITSTAYKALNVNVNSLAGCTFTL